MKVRQLFMNGYVSSNAIPLKRALKYFQQTPTRDRVFIKTYSGNELFMRNGLAARVSTMAEWKQAVKDTVGK